ncbi:MAG: hypothetical protein VYC17_05760 [Nitrospinota bacterium]|nr:hypothetical protein [Nitrospinota bacterium]
MFKYIPPAVIVGMVHGFVGSAPLLALLPMTRQGSPWIGLGYLLIFNLAVLVSMLTFGEVLGILMNWAQKRMFAILFGFRMFIASGAIYLVGYQTYDQPKY